MAIVDTFISARLAEWQEAEGMGTGIAAPRLRSEVRQSMLAELEAGARTLVALRQALLRGGLLRSERRLAAQLAIWAAEAREWAALEAVWLAYRPAEILVCPEVVAVFFNPPGEQRRRLPGLSIAYGIVQAMKPESNDFDVDVLVQALVKEGYELHAGWSRHARTESAVLAGSLWMLAQASVAGSLMDPGLGGAWDTQLALEQYIADRTKQGDAPSTRTMVAFHALSCGIAVLRSDWKWASFHAERGTTLSHPNDIFGLVAHAAWVTICLVTGNFAEFRRVIGTMTPEVLATESVQDLLGMAALVQANLRLDRQAAHEALNGRDLMASWLRWFNYQPMFIVNRAQAALLWGEPEGALAEFDSGLPRGSLDSADSYWAPILQRTRAELLLNVGAVAKAEAVIEDMLKSPNRILGLVPAARLQLAVANYDRALLLTEEGVHAVDVSLVDRSQLQAIRTAATLESGGDAAAVQAQLASACQLCCEAGSALGFAMLARETRDSLLEIPHAHVDDVACTLAEAAARGAFDELRQGRRPVVRVNTVELTPREKVLLPLLLGPLTVQQIADQLFVSVNTVRKQVVTLRRKLGARNRAELTRRARELGLATTVE